MKISKLKPGILVIFTIFVLIEGISFATYQTVVLGQMEQNKISAMRVKLENDETVLNDYEQEALDLINEYREQYGLVKLKPYSELQAVAKLKAEDLVNSEYFAHTSPNLGTPFEMLADNGVSYKIAGENLAGNTTPERAVEAWMNSPLHRENILEGKFEYTGISVIDSPIYGKVFVQLFIGIDK